MSMRPSFLTISSTRAHIPFWSVTSPLTYSSRPTPGIAAALSWTVRQSASGAAGMSRQYTAAPASASAKAISRPMPRCAPVMSATRLESEKSESAVGRAWAPARADSTPGLRAIGSVLWTGGTWRWSYICAGGLVGMNCG
ncbi:unnamed protein product [Mycena citricolor]|uniref:Uncharacterized protein n=1 Tax=Mycena citricolor TaxID=2018698 RepID=A0AAD2HWY2_9AGAR|nr:unnamed protein product [Mycena citricolor]